MFGFFVDIGGTDVLHYSNLLFIIPFISFKILIVLNFIFILFCLVLTGVRVWVMVFNATFNNISVISLRSVLLVEETGVPRENHRPAASHWQTLSHNVVSSTHSLNGIRTHNVSSHRHWHDGPWTNCTHMWKGGPPNDYLVKIGWVVSRQKDFLLIFVLA